MASSSSGRLNSPTKASRSFEPSSSRNQPWPTQASSVAGPSRPPRSRSPSSSPPPLVAIKLPSGSCTTTPSPQPTRRRKSFSANGTHSGGRKSKGKGKAPAGGGEDLVGRMDELEVAARTCAAVDRWDEECDAVVVGGLKGKVAKCWCAVHEAEESLVRSEYNKFAIAEAPASSLELPFGHWKNFVARIESPESVEEWEAIVRNRLDEVDKAQQSAIYHATHFSEDPRGSLNEFAVELHKEREALEARLRLLTARAHELILAAEDALWLCPSHPTYLPPTPLSPCFSSAPAERPPCAPALATETEEADPVLARDKQRRSELLELLSLTGSHASFLTDPQKSVERVRVVECLFRRVVSREDELLVAAHRSKCDHVLRFVESLSLPLLSLLWALLQATDAALIRSSIRDAFRAVKWEESGATETEPGEEGLGLQLLGGWSYKTDGPASGAEMGWREWSHLYDLVGCGGCALRCCATFNEWAKIRRLAVVPHGNKPPPYADWADAGEGDAGVILRCVDVVQCSAERTGMESEVRKVGGGMVGTKGKGVYLERQERNWVFLKLSLTHPRALQMLSVLRDAFTLIVRSTDAPEEALDQFPKPPPSHLWLSRHRSATSRPSLRHESWSIDPNGFGANNAEPFTILDSLDSPEKAQGLEPFDEVFELVVLDAFGHEGEGTGRTAGTCVMRTYEQFEMSFSLAVLSACGKDSVQGAKEWGEAEAYRRGDLLWDFEGQAQGGLMGAVGLGVKKALSERLAAKGEAPDAIDKLRDDKLALKLSRSLFR